MFTNVDRGSHNIVLRETDEIKQLQHIQTYVNKVIYSS